MVQVSYEIPEGLPDASTLLVAAQRLVQIPETADREDAVQTLFKLVHGVLAAPEEPKKRRVRKSNETFHRKVGRYSAGLDFLRGCGFVDTDGSEIEGEEAQGPMLFMPVAYLARLTDAHHTLARAAQQAGIAVPPLPGNGFNPFLSSGSSAEWAEADHVREEVRRLQHELERRVESAPQVELRPTVFWLGAGRRLEEVVLEGGIAENVPATGAKPAGWGGAHCTFESADKKLLAELRSKRVYESCVLRVICPDKSVLQLHFRAGDSGEHVMAQLAPLLAPHVRTSSWYLYQSPPLRRLALWETLHAAGLTPGAIVHLGFDSDERPVAPYLEESLVVQLGPKPQEEWGVKSPSGPLVDGEGVDWGVGHRLGGGPALTGGA
mmetsp:Transcript_54644/g.162648  ORF Transcript_54644/g.162648 Transcript_54644/m.162648 type:complete len:379 (+) Transcript_54644:60-1196(+)